MGDGDGDGDGDGWFAGRTDHENGAKMKINAPRTLPPLLLETSRGEN
jgi:hypothetical protein